MMSASYHISACLAVPLTPKGREAVSGSPLKLCHLMEFNLWDNPVRYVLSHFTGEETETQR